MRKVREVLRLRHALGLSYREISEALGVGKTAAGEIVRRADYAEHHGAEQIAAQRSNHRNEIRHRAGDQASGGERHRRAGRAQFNRE